MFFGIFVLEFATTFATLSCGVKKIATPYDCTGCRSRKGWWVCVCVCVWIPNSSNATPYSYQEIRLQRSTTLKNEHIPWPLVFGANLWTAEQERLRP